MLCLRMGMLYYSFSIHQWFFVPPTDPVTFVDYYKADYEPRPGSANPDEYKFYFVFLRENIFVANKNPDDVSTHWSPLLVIKWSYLSGASLIISVHL